MRSTTTLYLAATLALAACGGSSSSSTPIPSDATNQSFTGSLGDGSVIALSFGGKSQALTAAPASAATSAAVTVTGTITVPSSGATISLTGTYDPSTGAFTVSGGGYSLTGTYSKGVVQGTATTPAGSASFVAMIGDGSAVTRYCGTYESAIKETGTFNLVVKGGIAYVVVSGGMTLSGTVSGSAISLKDDHGRTVPGTISGTSVSGTFENDDGKGTWTGSTEACQAKTTPPPPATTCEVPAANPAGASQESTKTMQSGPPPLGGTISNGTYDLTLSVYFAQSDSNTTASADRRRFVISNGTIDVTASDATTLGRYRGTLAVDEQAKTLTVTVTCSSDPGNLPVGSQLTFGYTVEATLLKLHSTSHSTGQDKLELYQLQ